MSVTRTPANLWLYARLPDGKPVQRVEIDGRERTDIDPANERIRLPAGAGPMEILIRY